MPVEAEVDQQFTQIENSEGEVDLLWCCKYNMKYIACNTFPNYGTAKK